MSYISSFKKPSTHQVDAIWGVLCFVLVCAWRLRMASESTSEAGRDTLGRHGRNTGRCPNTMGSNWSCFCQGVELGDLPLLCTHDVVTHVHSNIRKARHVALKPYSHLYHQHSLQQNLHASVTCCHNDTESMAYFYFHARCDHG